MIDLFIIIVAIWAFFSGWRAGFLKEVISSVGVFIGLLVAATCYNVFGEYLSVSGSESNMFTSVVAFLLLWIAVPIALGFVANVLTKAVKGLQFGVPNSILGALVSLVKFFVLLSCVLCVMESLGIMSEEKTAESHLFEPTKAIVGSFFDDDTEQKITPTDESANGDTIWVTRKRDTISVNR